MQPDPIYIFYMGATPEKVWEAITGADGVRKMFFGARLETSFEAGSSYRYVGDDGKGKEIVYLSGTILECEPPRILRTTYSPGGESFVSELVYELEPVGDAVKLTITHNSEHPQSQLIQAVSGGWPRILSNLKSLLETGEVLLKA